MKKKILGGLLVVAIAAVAAFNVHMNTQPENELSLLALANVEALANGESGGINVQQCVYQGFVEDSKSAARYTLCNSSTTSSTIYKCPSDTKQGKVVGTIKYGTCYK